MSDLVHVGALSLAVLGAGSLIGVRRDVSVMDIAAVIIMTTGMIDAMTISLLPAVVWFAVMLSTAIALAISVRLAPAVDAVRRRGDGVVSAHVAFGLLSTATLILVMSAPTGGDLTAASELSAHPHGSTHGPPRMLAAGVMVGTVVSSVIALRSRPTRSHRLHSAAMSASTVAMAFVVLI